jgi:hypothetical protein
MFTLLFVLLFKEQEKNKNVYIIICFAIQRTGKK